MKRFLKLLKIEGLLDLRCPDAIFLEYACRLQSLF